MARAIYEVYAKIVDANGSYNTLNGYPKVFDSNNYDGDEAKTLRRAQAEFSECRGAMLKRDDRQIQTIILMNAKGRIVEAFTFGDFPAPVVPEPEVEPEEET